MEHETLGLSARRLAQPADDATLKPEETAPMTDSEENQDPDRDEPDNGEDYEEGRDYDAED